MRVINFSVCVHNITYYTKKQREYQTFFQKISIALVQRQQITRIILKYEFWIKLKSIIGTTKKV